MERAFVDRPGAPVDAGCVAAAHTLDVAGRHERTAALAASLYGRDTPLLGAP